MFVIRYLIAALATGTATLILCIWVGYSVWQSIMMALLAAFALQGLVLAYVVFATIRKMRDQSPRADTAPQPGERSVPPARDQLFILPK